MSAEIAQFWDGVPEIVPGGGGIFDVEAGGSLIFSKFESGRFPEPGEIASLLKL